jgi:transcriptional regulator with XRE-family HTH domain
LGLSRQAVSKWERAEASPDTDNLICLAKLYGVSLDDLLDTEESIDDIVAEQVKKDDNASAQADTGNQKQAGASQESSSQESSSTSDIHITDNGIHFKDGRNSGHLDDQGIHVESDDGSSVHIDSSGIHVKEAPGQDRDPKVWNIHVSSRRRKIYKTIEDVASGVTALLCVVAYLLCGFLIKDTYLGWGCSWVVFFLIPLVPSLVEALYKRKICAFAFPVLVTMIYLVLGMYWGLWHPYWVLFLTIPVYYAGFGPIDNLIARRHKDENLDEDDDNIIDIQSK